MGSKMLEAIFESVAEETGKLVVRQRINEKRKLENDFLKMFAELPTPYQEKILCELNYIYEGSKLNTH